MYKVLTSFTTGENNYHPGQIVEKFKSDEMANDLMNAGYIRTYQGSDEVDLSEYVRQKPGTLEEV